MARTRRIRLTKCVSRTDLEYFALRYVRLGEIYDVPAALARELVKFGYAALEEDEADAAPDRRDDSRK
jgi:hypothetical protein